METTNNKKSSILKSIAGIFKIKNDKEFKIKDMKFIVSRKKLIVIMSSISILLTVCLFNYSLKDAIFKHSIESIQEQSQITLSDTNAFKANQKIKGLFSEYKSEVLKTCSENRDRCKTATENYNKKIEQIQIEKAKFVNSLLIKALVFVSILFVLVFSFGLLEVISHVFIMTVVAFVSVILFYNYILFFVYVLLMTLYFLKKDF